MLDVDTKRRIDTARDILVGKIPDPKSQVEQITIALVYKFMDDMDEDSRELGGKATFFKGDYQKYAWHKIFDPKMSGIELVNAYGEAIQKMNQNPNIPLLFRDIFKNAYLPYRDPETLKSFLKVIGEFEYSHSEKLGDAFEYLLSVLGSQGEAGQFRTPRHIIDFMVEIVDPKKNESILDPACGTAGFLISSYKHILKHNSKNFDPKKDRRAFELYDVNLEEITINNKEYKGDKLSSDDKERLVKNIKGYDISPDMVRLSLVNMYLHEFKNPKIAEYDTLTSEDKWGECADVILANPPFMSPKGGIRPHKKFSIQSNRSEVLFVDYIAEHLTPQGRSCVIVPEGIIFQSQTAHTSLRKMLVEKNYLVGVISLPSGLFNPYSGVKTSILWLDKTLAKKTSKILFVKIEDDGFDLGAQRRPIKDNDLPEAFRAICAYKESLLGNEKFSVEKWKKILLIEKTKVSETGDYNLSGDRYHVVQKCSTEWPLYKLEDVCDIESGSRQKGGAVDSGVPSIGGEQISVNGTIKYEKMTYVTNAHFSDMKKGVLKKDDVLIVKDGATTGKTAFFDNDIKAAVNEHVFILRAKENILPKLLYNIIKSEYFQNKLQRYIKGIIGGISLEIKEIQIPLPPLSVQEEIIAEIEGYQKIANGARQVVENYKPHIDIDSSWPVVELGDVISLEYGKPLKEENRIKGGYPVFGSNGIVGWHNEYIVNGPFIVVGRKGTAGAVTYSDKSGYPIDTTFYVRITDENKLDLKFAYYQMLTMELDRVNTQSGVPGLNRNDAYKQKFYLPDLVTQKNVVASLNMEKDYIVVNNTVIKLFEKKIKERIAHVWGEK